MNYRYLRHSAKQKTTVACTVDLKDRAAELVVETGCVDAIFPVDLHTILSGHHACTEAATHFLCRCPRIRRWVLFSAYLQSRPQPDRHMFAPAATKTYLYSSAYNGKIDHVTKSVPCRQYRDNKPGVVE